jgi:Fe-S-cluster containining protein
LSGNGAHPGDDKKVVERYRLYVRERGASNWMNYIEALRRAGRLVTIGNVYCDGESLFRRRFRCDTRICAPGKNPLTGAAWRASGEKSCCAELVVDLTPDEIAGLRSHWPQVRDYLGTKNWWFRDRDLDDCLEFDHDFEVSLKKRGKRCVFALKDGDWGIRCGIHSACLELGLPLREVKPVTCDTFPLILIDLPNDEYFLGGYDEDVNPLVDLDDDDIGNFPCLKGRGKGPRMYVSMGDTIRSFFGTAFYERMSEQAERYLQGPRPAAVEHPGI